MTKILIVKTSSMGDVIHNLPIVSDILTNIPDASIDWVTEESYSDLVALHPGVSNVLPVAWRRWRKSLMSLNTWSEMRDFRYRLRRDEYDFIIDTQGLIKSAAIVKMARSGMKCGFSKEVIREPFATKAYDVSFAIPKIAHAVERNRWLAGAALEYYPDEHKLDYGLKVSIPAQVIQAKYAMCLPITSREDKLWNEDKWIALGKWLSQQGITTIFPSGSPKEVESVHRLISEIPSSILLPKLSLSELASWMKNAAVVIGVDTGLSHLGVALGRPTIGIYCNTSPQLVGLYAMKNAINLGDTGASPEVQDVIQAIGNILEQTKYQH